MGDSKVVFGVAVGSAFARSAVCPAATSSEATQNGTQGADLVSSSLNRPEIVVNADGDRGTPCIVARRGEGADEEWLVGEAAKSAMAGRDWASVKAWPGQVLLKGFKGHKSGEEEEEAGGEEGEAGVEDVCTRMLQQVLEQAENFSGESLSDCVLAVPSSFTEEERAAMIHTANMSGFSVKGLIREPVAAALAYYVTSGGAGLPTEKSGLGVRKVMVCDLGHSHLDVTILEEQEGILSLALSRTTTGGAGGAAGNVGGQAMTQKLVNLGLAEFKRKAGCDAQESRRAMTKLWRECESVLKVLSMSQQAEVEIDSLYEGYDLRMRVTRARFEGECFDIFRQCISSVESALDEASLAKDEINLLLLAGGLARIPKLQSMLSDLFPESTAVKTADVNPEEAVAIGAAVQAQLLTQAGGMSLPKSSKSSGGKGGRGTAHAVSVPLPISPFDLGVGVTGGSGRPILLIHRGTFLPAEQAFLVTKAAADQETVQIQIVGSTEPWPTDDDCSSNVFAVGEPAFTVPKSLSTSAQLRVDIRLEVDGSIQVSLQGADASVAVPLQRVTIKPANGEEQEGA